MTTTAAPSYHGWAWDAAACAHQRARAAAMTGDSPRYLRELEAEVELDLIYDRHILTTQNGAP